MDNKTKTFLRNCLKDYGAFYLIYMRDDVRRAREILGA